MQQAKGYTFTIRYDILRRNLPRTFVLIVAVFLVLQVITYLSKFEIHLVERVKKDTVLLEYQYLDQEELNGDDQDYRIAQEQALYNYRYRDDKARGKTNKTEFQYVAEPQTPEKYPNVTRVCSMKERLTLLRRYCDRDKTVDDTFQHKDLLVDEKHRVIYCSIPRVASTSYRTVMAKVTGNVPSNITWPPVHNKRFMQSLGLKFLGDYAKPDANRIAKEYFKVLVVRNPIDRLVSAWRDKLVVRNSPARWKLGTAILAEYRDEKHYELSREWNDTARFHEFVEYMADKNVADEQWTPYIVTCDVCMYQWNAILRLETSDKDIDALLSHFPNYKGGLPFLHSHQGRPSDVHHIQKRLPELASVSVKALENIKYKYEADFEIFGYDWNPESNMTRCAIQTTDGVCC